MLSSLVTCSFFFPFFHPPGGPLSPCRVLILSVTGSLLATGESFTGELGAPPSSMLGETEGWSRSVLGMGEEGGEGGQRMMAGMKKGEEEGEESQPLFTFG